MPADPEMPTTEAAADMLKAAARAVSAIDIRYHSASLDERLEMRDERDQAFNAYILARHQLLRPGFAVDPKEVEAIGILRREIDEAADQATLLAAAVKVAALLAKVAMI